MKNASNSQVFRDLDEHRRVVHEDDLRGWCLSDVQGKPKDVGIGFAHVDEAGGDERVDELVELKCENAVRVYLARFIADHNDFQAVPSLERGDKFEHPGVWLGLGKHEVPKLVPSERSLLVKDYPAQILFEREFSLLVRLEDQAMARLHLRPIHLEVLGRSFASQMIPSVGEQDLADL